MLENKKNIKNPYKPTKEFTLHDFFKIILIRKWFIIAGIVIGIGVSIYQIKTAIPVYQTSALIMRDMSYEQLPGSLLGTGGMMGFYSYRPTMNMDIILRSRPSIELMSKHILEKYNYSIAPSQIAGRIKLQEDEKNYTISVIASANDPKQAQIIANTAAEVLIEKTFELRKAEINQGAEFLGKQLSQIEERMQATEKALNQFRDREGLVPTETGNITSGLIGKLGELQTSVLQIESDIELKRTQLKTLEELIAEKKKFVQSSSVESVSPQIEQLQSRLINLQLDLSAKLQTSTERDPEVIALRKRIETTQGQLKSEFNKLLDSPGATTLDPITELQNLTEQYIAVNVELKGLETKGQLLNDRLRKFREDHPELASKQVELIRLERQSRIYEQSYASLASKYQDVRLMEQMKGAGLSIIENAGLPTVPISPKKNQIIITAVLFGLALGLGVAFFLEYIDDSIKTKEDVERYLELPVLGLISEIGPFNVPVTAIKKRDNLVLTSMKGDNVAHQKSFKRMISRKSDKEILKLLSHSLIYSPNGSTKTPAVENYWNLAMSIKYANMDSPVKTILVTSVVPGERKTTTSSNLAIIKARSGMKVLLIDSDLRRPMIHRIFQQNRKPGLADLLTVDNLLDNGEFESIIHDSIRPTVIENLYLLPCGSSVPNSDALLSSEKMQNLLESLKEKFDLIIIDSAPLLVVAGVIALSKEADGVLLSMYSGKTRRKLALHGKEMLDDVNARIIGVVLTDVDMTRQYGYYYRRYYNYYYQHKDDNE
ncbi:TPA: polysaccharide biosynthesis tyrosine autokinase [bacterium]|nr:polysaccharide biosynthesis tyrosine autokinase [bacterium]